MAKRRQRTKKIEEPIGIIIAQEPAAESTPRFSAYVYGLVDEPEEDPSGVKAA